jgi:LuxR family transcriptional regulator, maltose regulon positive regulatory protein
MSQPKRRSLPAKLTRPQARTLVPRERVFAMLDNPDARTIWIKAPAGAGKTSLASSWIQARGLTCLWAQLDAGDADPATLFHYLTLAGLQHAGPKDLLLPPLTPEFLPGMAVYARRFFEQLLGLYPEPFAVVLDNCHEVPTDAPFSSVLLPALFDSLPGHGRLLCLSRGPLPPAMVRWRLDPGFQQIGWEDVSFTDGEARHFAALVAPAPGAVVSHCNQYVQGWITGLKLLLRAGPGEIDRLANLSSAAPQALFDYFAEEVLQRSPLERREFLLRCAVLADMEGQTATVVTGRDDAATVLDQLYDERLFIERRSLPGGPSYRFHPLFRDFLLGRLEHDLGSTAVAQLKARAATALEQSGQLEAATLIALEGGDAALLARLILAQAPLLASQGRFSTLDRWLSAVPEAVRSGDGWLSYWFGVARSPSDPVRGRTHLEHAYHRFRASGDRPGMWLAAAAVIGNQFITWGAAPEEIQRWIGVFETLRAEEGGAVPEAIELQVFAPLCMMISHCPELPLSRHLAERARVLAPRLADPHQRCSIGGVAVGHLTWQGDEVSAWALIETLQRRGSDETQVTLASLTFDTWHSILLWTGSQHERCMQLLTPTRELCRRAGLGFFEWQMVWQQALCALSAGDYVLAYRFIREGLDLVNAEHVFVRQLCRGAEALSRGLAGEPAAGAAVARELMASGGFQDAPPTTAAMLCCFTASALLEAGALDEASACTARALELASRLPSDRWTFDASFLMAGIALERGLQELALDRLKEALRIGAARNFGGGVSLFQPDRTARLLALALREGVEPEYTRRLIRRRRLGPPRDLPPDGLWPIRLRVLMLGRFSVLVDDEPLRTTKSAARKPLEVLKALAGLGPTDVSLGTLGVSLWPELDGDAAHNACHVAIHRLRRILGDDSFIEVDRGVASLNQSEAWVDVEAFRRLAGRVRTSLSAGIRSASEVERLTRELLAVYPGHFLPGEDRPWAVGIREQLRTRFVRLAADLSVNLERSGAHDTAIELNRHGIELDPLAETFHRGLIRALQARGQKAEALEAFRRCRVLLRKGLNVEPSAETLALYARIH